MAGRDRHRCSALGPVDDHADGAWQLGIDRCEVEALRDPGDREGEFHLGEGEADAAARPAPNGTQAMSARSCSADGGRSGRVRTRVAVPSTSGRGRQGGRTRARACSSGSATRRRRGHVSSSAARSNPPGAAGSSHASLVRERTRAGRDARVEGPVTGEDVVGLGAQSLPEGRPGERGAPQHPGERRRRGVEIRRRAA